jgi:hypothetical protein
MTDPRLAALERLKHALVTENADEIEPNLSCELRISGLTDCRTDRFKSAYPAKRFSDTSGSGSKPYPTSLPLLIVSGKCSRPGKSRTPAGNCLKNESILCLPRSQRLSGLRMRKSGFWTMAHDSLVMNVTATGIVPAASSSSRRLMLRRSGFCTYSAIPRSDSCCVRVG